MSVNPRDRERNPQYYAARRALAQHMHRHHSGAAAHGTLSERLAAHDDVHWHCTEKKVSVGHTHTELSDGEHPYTTAHRYLAEGEGAHG